jgi:hypothetical protein
MLIVYECKAVCPVDPGYTGDCSGDSLRWPRQERQRVNGSSVSIAHRDTDTATVSPASDTYPASLSATTNVSALSHSFPGLPAPDTIETI